MNIEAKDQELRSEIGFLGSILGETIREFAGDDGLATVERLRKLAWDRRLGIAESEQQMVEAIAKLDDQQMRLVIRAFSVFLDLLNMVEDRRRVFVLGERARESYPRPRRESIREAMATLKSANLSAIDVQSLLDRLQIELVFTAHPTDAKRRSVRHKLTTIREIMTRLDGNPLPEDRDRAMCALRGEVAKLWQTDLIRPWRPTVIQEVARGLSIKPVLWDEIPRIHEELDRALQENFGPDVKVDRPFLTFGSWIGGDRDGHPGVTSTITEQTVMWLRREAIAFHHKVGEKLFHSLSLSARQSPMERGLGDAISEKIQQFPSLDERLAALPPGELCRRWLSIILWHLEQTQLVSLREAPVEGAYHSSCELFGDVERLRCAIEGVPCGSQITRELVAWQSQIKTFGFHLARLDVRQNAKVYSQVMDEVLKQTGLSATPESLDEASRIGVLQDSLHRDLHLRNENFTAIAVEALETFRTLHRVVHRLSLSAIGAHVISMTAEPSDVLTVLWLWKHTAEDSPDTIPVGPPIVPLLETIGDLKNGPAILSGMLQIPAYREYLKQHGNHQMIMLGYSDSTKDGGYLSACWSLYLAQKQLVEVASREGVDVTFFHGRGGSLGRGGGPAARSILSLPQGTFRGSLRLTEQGEVLADRYDNPAIAHRHLEQVIWSSLLAASDTAEATSPVWIEWMSEMADASFLHYRNLLEQPDFVEFFRLVTPISEIEQLPIGSRPSSRKPGGGLNDLRAIPWVFSWTQSRCLLPAWYGLGTAMASRVDNPENLKTLKTMYKDWRFFRALVDNAELALAKSDLGVAKHYASLSNTKPSLNRIADLIAREYNETCRAVLRLTDQTELLGGTPWLKESIRVRNRFIDPLNLIQVELLRRGRAAEFDIDRSEELRHLTRLSINGIAAGMRTSG